MDNSTSPSTTEPIKTGIEKAREVASKIKDETTAALESVDKAPAKTEATLAKETTKKKKIKKSEVALVDHELAPAEIKDGQIIFTKQHLDLIKTQIAPTATKVEFEMFLMMSRRMRLDPLLKQIYFIKYEGKNGNPDKVSYVTSIDSYRLIAHRTGEFAGVDLPVFEYNQNGMVTHASITVYKLIQGQRFGFSAKVKFSEYTTGKNQWATKPETMIAKVAEAHALRKAFPQDLSGVYTQDEMDQATPADVVTKPQGQIAPQQPAEQKITSQQVVAIKEILKAKGKTSEDARAYINANFRGKAGKDLTVAEAGRMISAFALLPDPTPVSPAEAEEVFGGVESQLTPEQQDEATVSELVDKGVL